MKNKTGWKILLLLGIFPFVVPFITGIYMSVTESWDITDWLVMYSFIYWPTYILGLILIVLSVYKLVK